MMYRDNEERKVIMLARYMSKLYPELKLMNTSRFADEEEIISSKPLIDRLVSKGIMKQKSVDALRNIFDDYTLEEPGLFVEIGKKYFSKKKLSEEKKQDYTAKMDIALEEQEELKRKGRYKKIGDIMKEKGFREIDIEAISTIQIGRFMLDNAEAAAEVKKRFQSRISGEYLKQKKIMSGRPLRDIGMAAALGGIVTVLGWMYMSSRPKPMEMGYDSLPKMYSNILYSVQFKEKDNSLEGFERHMGMTQELIDRVQEDGTPEQKRKAGEYERKLELFRQNIEKAKEKDNQELLSMKLSDIERMMLE